MNRAQILMLLAAMVLALHGSALIGSEPVPEPEPGPDPRLEPLPNGPREPDPRRDPDPAKIRDLLRKAQDRQAKTTEEPTRKVEVTDKTLADARQAGLKWLMENQAKDGHWGKTYPIAVTSFATLAILSAEEEPFKGEAGKMLLKAVEYLLSQQSDGVFKSNGHSWIHGQGFATLALSETYGRALLCRTKPDLDLTKLAKTIQAAVKAIETNQSTSGGWWYTQGNKRSHEGSTTVTAVQAIVSAKNFGFVITKEVLDKGFDYLKKCQNPDGGFDYKLGDSTSMREGTAADVATLALMKKFDYAVMMNGKKFLVKMTPARISQERFQYYGHFYGCMGMRLLGQELRGLRKQTDEYTEGALADVLSWQDPKTGAWPIRGNWFGTQENEGYATAFATLIVSVPQGRLSIFNRKPPKLPEADKPEPEKGDQKPFEPVALHRTAK